MIEMKKWIALFFALILFFVAHTNVNADEENQLVVDLNTTEQTALNYIDSQTGEEISLAVEPVKEQTTGKRFRRALSAGTYKVSKSSKGAWSVTFNIKVSNKSQIISANNLSVIAHRGSIISSSLVHDSKKATCVFKQKAGLVQSTAKVIADISSGKLVVR